MKIKKPIAKLSPFEKALSWKPRGADSIKISDSDGDVSRLGRLDRYWKKRGFTLYFKNARRPELNVEMVAKVTDGPDPVIKKFKLKGIEFGNWVNEEDRVNYLYCMVAALYDLNKVLSFNFNIGINNNLSVAFGARGTGGRAMAHYEPGTQTINLTRYSQNTKAGDKDKEFANSGGMGAFAHEYGHFLDYFFGRYIDQSTTNASLTLGDYSGSKLATNYPKGSMRAAMQSVILSIIYSKPGTYSPYYLALKKKLSDDKYWFRHNELFARAFEQYVQHKLLAAGVQNKFLSKVKYTSDAYMKPGDLARVLPHIDKLVKMFSATVKS
jgi:conjugative element/phage-associated large polyvalent protein